MSTASIGYIDIYRLLNVVNVGQSSRLWQAYNDDKREFVAIKVLLNKFVNDKIHTQLLKREYEVASKLSHPRLIQIRQFGWHQKTPYLVMEWFPGSNAKILINRGYEHYCKDLPKIFLQSAESLVYLHSQGWMHRDIKPDNLIYNDEGGIKLIDFALAKKVPSGIAKIFGGKSPIVGTLSYMSPEQIRGKAPSPSADIYSLGCTFYELLTGRLPFAGETINDLLGKHLNAIPPSVAQRNKNVTPEFTSFVRSMMGKTSADRPKTMEEVYKLLKTLRVFIRTPSNNDL